MGAARRTLPRVSPAALRQDRSGGPRALQVAAALVAVEAMASLAVAVVELLAVNERRLVLGVTTTAFFVLYALALLGCAWALAHQRRWSRAPVVLTQLIQLGVAWSFAGGATIPVALLLGAAAAGVLVAVFLPSSTAALTSEV